MANTVLVIGPMKDGGVPGPVWETLGAAAELAAGLNGDTAVLLMGKGASGAAAEASARGAGRVLTADDDRLERYVPEAFAAAAEGAARGLEPAAILAPVSAFGRDLMARLAARLDAGLATDCVGLSAADGSVEAVRPVYAGKALLKLRFEKRPALATVRPNTFAAPAAGGAGGGEPEAVTVPDVDGATRVVEVETEGSGKPDQTEAAVIVAGGRGMASAENFKLLEDLADALGGVVGASRAVVDADWRPHAEQIGQTGKTVSPALYVACGISGAIQHLAGMRTSKTIVAVNKDADAPIFKHSTYGIVGDALDVLPKLIEEVRRAQGGA
jgi:electron transfer flavoprotein alpha subunit